MTVPGKLNPFEYLSVEDGESKDVTRMKFMSKLKKSSRQDRALASLAFAMLTSKSQSRYKREGNEFTIHQEDAFVLATIGFTKLLVEKIWKNRSLIEAVDEKKQTLLYIAARSGFYDMTRALLLAEGCPINTQQTTGSTALHAASFYGQKDIVQLLLEHGADPSIKNKWGSTANNEAAKDDIKMVFGTMHEDKIGTIQESLRKSHKLVEVKTKYYMGELVGQELCLEVDSCHSSWEIAWHGTQYMHVDSILLHGLKCCGDKLPNGETNEPQAGHYELGKTYFGVDDWAKAVFVSPSVLYAAHACYAERVMSLGKTWAVLVGVLVRPSSYTSHDPAAQKRQEPVDNEPDAPEYRVAATVDDKILRISSSSDVVVRSVLFISVQFLDNLGDDMTYDMIKNMFK